MILFLWLLLLPGFCLAEVTGKMAAFSNFIWRGVTFTENRPAIQADLDAENKNGYYVGAFLSNAEFSDEVYEATVTSEIDVLLGKRWETSAFDIQIYYSRYFFPGAGFFDTDEFNFQVDYKNTKLELSYVPSYFGYESDYRYARITQKFPIRKDFKTELSVGYNAFSNPKGDVDSRCLDASCSTSVEGLDGAGNPDYIDAFLAFSKFFPDGREVKVGINMTNREEIGFENGEVTRERAKDFAVLVGYLVPFTL